MTKRINREIENITQVLALNYSSQHRLWDIWCYKERALTALFVLANNIWSGQNDVSLADLVFCLREHKVREEYVEESLHFNNGKS